MIYKMRIVVFSSTEFGHRCITAGVVPAKGSELAGIVTTEPVIDLGNGKSMTLSTHANFEQLAKESNCELIKISHRPSVADYTDILKRTGAEIVLVLGWYFMIPTDVLSIPDFGMLGIHASLLPKYRGMAPVNWVLINGETETGVTLFYIAEGIDEGDIVAQIKIPIRPDDDCQTLYEKVSVESIKIIRKNLPLIASGIFPRLAQDHSVATKFPRRKPEDGQINFNQTAIEVHNFVRAQTRPYPGVFTMKENRKLTIWKTAVTELSLPEGTTPGSFISKDNRLFLNCTDTTLEILDIEIEGMSLNSTTQEQIDFLSDLQTTIGIKN